MQKKKQARKTYASKSDSNLAHYKLFIGEN